MFLLSKHSLPCKPMKNINKWYSVSRLQLLTDKKDWLNLLMLSLRVLHYYLWCCKYLHKLWTVCTKYCHSYVCWILLEGLHLFSWLGRGDLCLTTRQSIFHWNDYFSYENNWEYVQSSLPLFLTEKYVKVMVDGGSDLNECTLGTLHEIKATFDGCVLRGIISYLFLHLKRNNNASAQIRR